jgi:hypothetical protein
VAGESGKKNQKNTEMNKVRIPMMVTNHCQGSKPGVRMWIQPKASKPEKMTAAPLVRTVNVYQNE